MERPVPSTDILRLFSEDLDATDRVEAFKHASNQISDEVKKLATRPNVRAINNNYDLKFIFNSHGDGVDAGQSLRTIQDPFITFVENAGDSDIAQSKLFSISTANAFDLEFNKREPLIPSYPITQENAWNYWRDRGLLAKGSIIMPVDIRHYSRRLLDALMGSDYDQGYLSSSVPMQELTNLPFEDLLEEQKNKGLMVMYSNAVRELTSAKQIIDTMLLCLDIEGKGYSFEQGLKDKLHALVNKRRSEDGKLSANVIYGSGHHGITHVFSGLGINVSRQFPAAGDAPGFMSQVGKTKDQFFSLHAFNPKKKELESKTDKYARQHIIESILWCPLDYPLEYALVPESDKVTFNLWAKIAYIARRPDLVERAEDLHADFKSDPFLPVKILEDYGVRLKPISS